MKKLLPLIAALTTATLLTACGGGGGGDDPTQVATSNTTAPVTASTVAAIVGQSFDFSSGVPELGTATPTTLTVNSSSAFSLQSTEGTATGDLSYGSCIFTIRTSTYPIGSFIFVGRRIEIVNCGLNIPTRGVGTFGGERTLNVTFALGSVFSVPKPFGVDIRDDGTVVLNGTTVGSTSVGTTTGATGASGN